MFIGVKSNVWWCMRHRNKINIFNTFDTKTRTHRYLVTVVLDTKVLVHTSRRSLKGSPKLHCKNLSSLSLVRCSLSFKTVLFFLTNVVLQNLRLPVHLFKDELCLWVFQKRIHLKALDYSVFISFLFWCNLQTNALSCL